MKSNILQFGKAISAALLVLLFLVFGQANTLAQQRVANNDIRSFNVDSKTGMAVGDETPPRSASPFVPRTTQSVVVNRYDDIEDGETMWTYYDLQSNKWVSNRMYQLPNGSVAVTATMSHVASSGGGSDRGTGYNFYNGEVWLDQPEERVEEMRTGWPTIAQWGDNGEILISHAPLRCWTREVAGQGEWVYRGELPAHPDNYPYSDNASWPRVATSGDHHDIIHVIADVQHSINSSDVIHHQFYYRSTDAVNWTCTYSPLAQDGEEAGHYTADSYNITANGHNVAMIYGDELKSHVVMYKSTNDGQIWERTVIWENPYYGYDWENDPASIYTDTVYGPASFAIAIDNQGVAHVALSAYEYIHSELGSTYTTWSGRNVDGIYYWNDTQVAPIQSENGNPHDALRLWWPDEENPGYSTMHADPTKWIGYMPLPQDEDGNLIAYHNDYFYRENDYFYKVRSGLSVFPALSIDPMGNIACAYSTPDITRIDNETGKYYRSIYVSYRNVSEGYWHQAVDNITDADVNSMFLESENIYTNSVDNTANEGEFWFSFQSDDTQGLYVGSGASQANASDNKIHVIKVVHNPSVTSFAITAIANPSNCGTISGTGVYENGNICTLQAVANDGYSFVNWSINDSVVSTDASYSFVVTEARCYTANFDANSYSFSVTVNPTEGGTVSGAGTFNYGETCTLSAIPNEGYTFIYWIESGVVVSTDTVYSFQVTSNRTLSAVFANYTAGTGLLNGIFSVNQNVQVGFSQGNLQYQASTNTWRFAANQYDHIGSGNQYVSPTYDGWIDLFGWGTSGYNHGAICYQPWGTSGSNSDYYAYGSFDKNLYDETGLADWGYNAISNGGNATNQWRTLRKEEWDYLLNTRNTTSGVRFVKAKVNGVNGVLLLPDNWSSSTYSLNNANSINSSYSNNTISAYDWTNVLEVAGAVFLPETSIRMGGGYSMIHSRGDYWSSSYMSANGAYALYFYDGDVTLSIGHNRYDGKAVRLIQVVQVTSYNITTTANPVEGGSIQGAGLYEYGSLCTLTATTNEGCTFINWTENGQQVSADATYSFSVTGNRDLVANFSIPLAITAISNPVDGGTITGGGLYNYGQTCTLTAIPNERYYLCSWTENDVVVSHSLSYTFDVTENKTIVANFGDCFESVIGLDAMETNQYLPSYSYFNYSLSQQIYTADEIGWGGEINRIALFNDGYTKTRNYDIYLVKTEKTSFDNNTDWITATPEDLVFSGNVIMEAGTWTNIILDTIFIYDNSLNLAVIIDDNTGNWTSAPHMACRVFDTDNNQAIRVFSDNTNYDPYNPTQYSGTMHMVKNQISFGHLSPFHRIVTTSINYQGVGTVNGSGVYYCGDTCTLTAIPNEIVVFKNWTKNDSVVSTDVTYSFIVTENECLVANFSPIVIPDENNIIYVKPIECGLGDGSSWENATDNLNLALLCSSLLSEKPVIWVAAGTYFGDGIADHNAFTMVEGVNVYGSFVGNEPADLDLCLRDFEANKTILDGQNQQRVLYQSTYFYTNTIWDGFTLRNGYCNEKGGGGYFRGGVKLVDFVISSSFSNNGGGGIYLYNSELSTSVVEYNSCPYGGGLQCGGNSTVTNCVFKNNTATISGGAAYVWDGIFYNCLFVNNTNTNYYGGAIYADGRISQGYDGGTYVNCDIVNNVSTRYSAIYNSEDGGTFLNCIIWGNVSTGGYSQINNSGNFTYCAIQGGYDGVGNINLTSENDGADNTKYYVRFTDPTNNDYHLNPISACIDNGEPEFNYTITIDLDGNPRVYNDRVDMGCYESEVSQSCPPVVNLSVNNVGFYTATVSWTPYGDEEQWLLDYSIVGSNNTESSLVTDTVFTLTDLHHNRDYVAKVKALCSDSTQSVFSIPVYFTTYCDTVNDVLPDFVNDYLPVDNGFVYSQMVSFSWTNIMEGSFYDFHLWKENSDFKVDKYNITNNHVSQSLPGYEYGALYRWCVVAHYECLEKTSDTLNFMVSPLSDLHATQINHSYPVLSGRTITVEWTVTNDGEGTTPPGKTWKDNIWISPVAEIGNGWWIGADEHKLASVDNVMSLSAGESYTNMASVTIPLDYAGDYYLWVMADQNSAIEIDFSPTGSESAPVPYTPSITGNPYPYLSSTSSYHLESTISEVNDKDNFFYDVITVQSAPTADLVVTNIAHPTNIISGSSMPLSFTVENQGVALASGSWYDAVYLSSSPTLNMATANHIGSFLHEDGLEVGQTYSYSTNVDIPIRYYDSYYVFVVTDVGNAVYESIMEDNNTLCSTTLLNITMAACPNLVVTSVTAPSAMSVSKTYEISFAVKNIGAGVAEESSWNDVVFLSRDEVLDYGDKTIKTIRHNNNGALAQDATYTCTTDITIPNNISGEWFVLVKTDKDNEVFEFLDDGDNVGHTVNPSTILIPELAITELWVDDVADPNVPTEVEWTVTNNGAGLAQGTLSDYIAFENQTIANAQTYIHLERNESVVVSKMVSIPCVNASSGTITVTTNKYFGILDADSTNNVISNSMSIINPDLLVENNGVSENGSSSEQIEIKYTVTNNGSSSVNKNATDRIYLSSNQNNFSNATLLCSYQRQLNLGVGETENVDLTANLPDGISGTYYIGVFVDYNNQICEGDDINSNNVVTAIEVALSPYPNLQVVSASIESTPIYIGTYATISYSILNAGEGAVNNKSWTTKFYASPTATYSSNTAKFIGEHRITNSIASNETIDVTADLMIPISISAGYYYLVAITDVNNEVYEYNGENDNRYIGARYQFNLYPCDLQATDIGGSSEVEWGATSTFILHGKNSSDVATLYSQWADKLYLSTDNSFSADDLLLGTRTHNGHLEPGEDYQTVFNVTIPYGMEGDCYLIGRVGAETHNPDMNSVNNFISKSVVVNSVPTPDLELTAISVIDDLVGGQPSRIAYTVTNMGDFAVQNKQWNDRFYLSSDGALSNDDRQLNNIVKQMSLNINESYTDTIEIVIPIQYSGSYYLIAKANATQSFFESSFGNNTTETMVHVSMPLPGDLVVQNVLSEYEIVSGDRLHVSWKVKNIGENTLSGNGLKTLVYMSADTLFDVNDKLLGSVINGIMLPPNATVSQNLITRISGVPEGEYYLIVTTNVTKTFNESDFENNSTVSTNPFNVTLRVLPYSVPITDTLENNLANDYRLNVGDNIMETVRIHLHSADSLQGAVNNIFVTHNGVGSNLNFDYSTIEQYTANPELYIPSTQLEYYGVNVIGSTPVGNEQNTTIQADILPFDLRAINPNYGGNTGKVTVELTGSKFSPDMTVKLINAEATVAADTVYYQSFNKAFAKFDLKDKPVGFYSIVVSSLCEGDVFLENAFEIRQGEPEKLSTNIIYPNSPRPNRNIVMMLEFGNTGNIDITAPVIKLTSVGGSWIALTSEGVPNHETEILIPLQIEGDPQGVLKPDSYGVINIFCFTSNTLVFTITRIQ